MKAAKPVKDMKDDQPAKAHGPQSGGSQSCGSQAGIAPDCIGQSADCPRILAERAFASAEPAESNFAGDSATADSAGSDSAASTHTGLGSARHYSAGPDSATADSAGAESAGPDSATAVSTGADSVGSTHTGFGSARHYSVSPDSATAVSISANSAGSDSATADSTGSSSTGSSSTGAMLLPLICAALLLFFPLYFIFSGDPGFLENEKKYASELPPFTADNVLSGAWGEDAEAWLADKMPLRGFWVGLNAYFAYATGRQNATDVYIDSRGDLLERPEGYDAAELGKRLGRIAEFAAASGGRTAVLAVPSAGYCAKPYLPGYVWSGFNDSELFGRISAAIAQPAAQAPAERAAAQQSLLPATAPAQLLHTLAVAPMQSAFAPAPALRSLAAAQAPARQGLLPSAALALAPAPAQPDAQAPAAAPARSAWQALSTAPVPSGSAGFIDILGEFAGTAEPMFYRTDHHWNMDGAYAAYRQVCRYFGFEPFERGRFSVSSVGGFYGSTYSTSGLWLAEPDTVELWQPPEQVSVTFSDKEGAYGSIFFESHLEALDKYPVFLDGNHPLTIVENLSPSAEARAAGTLLVVKDSYANSLVPLLIGHYSKIALIDLRYYRQSASETAAAQNASDILIVYSAKNLAGDADLLWLR